jgi:hypothetical protein
MTTRTETGIVDTITTAMTTKTEIIEAGECMEILERRVIITTPSEKLRPMPKHQGHRVGAGAGAEGAEAQRVHVVREGGRPGPQMNSLPQGDADIPNPIAHLHLHHCHVHLRRLARENGGRTADRRRPPEHSIRSEVCHQTLDHYTDRRLHPDPDPSIHHASAPLPLSSSTPNSLSLNF